MNAVATIAPSANTSVTVAMAERYGMAPTAFEATVRATVCKGNVSREEFAAFLLVAKEHRLNPLTKEIYAFPAKGGGIQPIVSIDGWARIINEHPAFDGMEFVDERDDGELVAITCRMFRKDRAHPIAATEYMKECVRATDVWRTWPRRMLRHKAMIQCARYAFGFSGIIDPDEFERMEGGVPAPRQQRRLHADFEDVDTLAITHDPETGEVEPPPAEPEAAAEDVFPGDLPPAAAEPVTETAGPTLAQRADQLEQRIRDATATAKLTSIWAANAKLRDAIDQADPDRMVAIEGLFNDRFAAVEDLERAQ